MQETFGNASNLFAVRSVNEFSFDGEIWYKEGDKVHIVPNSLCKTDAVIKTIDDTGTILIETEWGSFRCRIEDIGIGRQTEKGSIDYQYGDVIAFRESNQFSIDFDEWYGEGQSCIVKCGDEILIGAKVRNILDNGTIVFWYRNHTRKIDYRNIVEIWDYESHRMRLIHETEPVISTFFLVNKVFNKALCKK